MRIKTFITLFITMSFIPAISLADTSNFIAFTATPDANGITNYTFSLKILAAMTFITLMPALLMTATSFTRIIIVLAILRQALGMPNIPTNQILIGLSLLITFFVMSPVFTQVNDTAIQPYIHEQINEEAAIAKTIQPFRSFMLNQTRTEDLNLFLKMAKVDIQGDNEKIPLSVLITSFITSELKTAFQIGFILFIPFLIIDLVVASVLMSMGMMMLSPMIISLPFKIMLFVLVNGWALVIGTLSSSFAF